jgi:two-component system phosphate regulon sensor histidine kinase PhoR
VISDEHAAVMLQALKDPAIMVDGARKVMAANQPARDMFGAFRPGSDLALSLRHPEALDAIASVIAGTSFTDAVISQTVPTPRVFEMHVAALAREPGDKIRVLCVLRDVTAAREAERIRADFVANVSHELRSPLVSLIGFIETLKGPARDDPKAQSRFLDIMDGEAQRMSRIVNDLLSLSRVQAGEHVPPAGSVDIGALLNEIVRTVAPRAAEKAMRLEFDVAADLPAVPGDRDELAEVFHNLIDNAVKYGRPNTAISIVGKAAARIPDIGGGGIAVSVSNAGAPIAPEHIPRLTERFYRVDKGRSRDMGGTGLGLAIVKHIVNHHRGRLTIESNPESGNTFTVFLPLSARNAPAPQDF